LPLKAAISGDQDPGDKVVTRVGIATAVSLPGRLATRDKEIGTRFYIRVNGLRASATASTGASGGLAYDSLKSPLCSCVSITLP
jgi:hypothetical protein